MTFERFTDRARKVMQLAKQESERLGHNYIGTENILLGLVKEGSGVAANVLQNLEVDLCRIRTGVAEMIEPSQRIETTHSGLPDGVRTFEIFC